jgi:hypothetical protein
VFCQEDIRPGASVCPHCGSPLAPLQDFADRQAELERRLAVLEEAMAAQPAAVAANSNPSPAVEQPPLTAGIRWPHMVDNIFLGLAVLVTAHWLATTLPSGSRTWFRLVALIVALPFGFRFERHSKASTSSQVVAALAFGSLGTLLIGVLDLTVAGHGAPTPTPQDIIASVATITLSHFAGSAWAYFRQSRTAGTGAVAAGSPSVPNSRHIQPAEIKGTAEAIKAMYDAAAPIAAGAAALWAAFGHIFS